MNNMADFDQLLKDKVEQAKYSYKHAAWKGFAKRAGFKAGLSGLQIAAITVAVVAVITGITLGVVFSGQPTPNGDQGAVVGIQDTMETQYAVSPTQDNVEHGTADSEQRVKETQKPASLPKTNDQQPMANGQQPISNPQQPTTNTQRPKYGPPLEINVDTITQMVPTDEQLRNGNSRIF